MIDMIDGPARISRKIFPQEFPARFSRKIFPQDIYNLCIKINSLTTYHTTLPAIIGKQV